MPSPSSKYDTSITGPFKLITFFGTKNLDISENGPGKARASYYAKTHTFGGPSVTLHAGSTKTGPVVGAVELHGWSSDEVCLGNPKAGNKAWTEVNRSSIWSRSEYSFTFPCGPGRVNTRFIWRRVQTRTFRPMGDMELVAAARPDEVLAEYASSGVMSASQAVVKVKGELEQELDMMVLLTILALHYGGQTRSRTGAAGAAAGAGAGGGGGGGC
ncbi:hypothetical protein V493_03964 [Pseudogymnoascus sp. VKM F-4281 (FW-2241)]|nr:hypothetical protein V493_03964 [Pseudogymnoascus sp. VKM F-4281 (FW-2241)]